MAQFCLSRKKNQNFGTTVSRNQPQGMNELELIRNFMDSEQRFFLLQNFFEVIATSSGGGTHEFGWNFKRFKEGIEERK